MKNHADTAADDVHHLLYSKRDPGPDRAQTVLEQSFQAAASTPDGELLMALYVYGLCLEKWEKSEDYSRIRTVLEALGRVHEKRSRERPGDAAGVQFLSRIVGQAQLLDLEMGVEEAMNCSCPVAMQGRAGRIVAGLETLDGRPGGGGALSEDLASLRDVVRSDADASRVYFRNLVDVGDVVFRFVHPEAKGPADFGGVVGALAEAERDPALGDDVYASELRAHRAALEALDKQAAESPSLWIDAAEVVYVYPFALRGISPEEAVDRALRGEVVTTLEDACGLRPASAHELAVNDLWDRDDRAELGYSGTLLKLPDITVLTTAHEFLEDEEDRETYATLTLSAEVRLSRLGNHYVRVTSELPSGHPHYVNQALRRGSRAMGAEKLTSAHHRGGWQKVAEYADDVIRTIACTLRAVPVTNVDAPFHVVLGARAISLRKQDGRPSPATVETLEQAMGATLLFHPVRHLATSLEEWIRYPPPAVVNLLRREGYAEDLVARTDNTTVVFMPKSPEWLIDEYEEMVEFVASVPPLLTHWEKRALRLDRALERSMRSEESSVGTLHDQELKILELEQDVRRQLAFLRSPALCRTRAQRRFLDDLWKAAGLPALEEELERHLTRLAERQERIAAMIRRKEQEHRRQEEEHRRQEHEQNERLRHRVQIVLAVIAGASLAGALQWFNDAFGVEARTWAILELIGLAVVVLVVGAVVGWTRRGGKKSGSGGSSSQSSKAAAKRS